VRNFKGQEYLTDEQVEELNADKKTLYDIKITYADFTLIWKALRKQGQISSFNLEQRITKQIGKLLGF